MFWLRCFDFEIYRFQSSDSKSIKFVMSLTPGVIQKKLKIENLGNMEIYINLFI